MQHPDSPEQVHSVTVGLLAKRVRSPILGIIAVVTVSCMTLLSGGLKAQQPGDVPATCGHVWTKYPGNPVLASGPSEARNNLKSDPTVVKDGEIYKMWYGTNQDGTRTTIAYAESSDGVHWETYPEPVLEPGPPDSWEGADVETPTVIIDHEADPEERYKMWYSGRIADQEPYRIGYATSPDGIHWTRYEGNPVLDVGNQANYDWDGWSVTDPMVIKENGVYKMWYSGAGEVLEEGTWHFWIGYAISEDGIHWQKYAGNPVLGIGPEGSFESRAVGQPAVVFNDSEYQMWYSGWDEIDTTWSSEIGYATSPDGIHWTTSADNPVLSKGEPATWDAQQVVAPTVWLEGEEYKMWYTGMRVEKVLGIVVDVHIGIGYATMEQSGPCSLYLPLVVTGGTDRVAVRSAVSESSGIPLGGEP